MLAAQIPAKFPIPWGLNAQSGNIRSIPVLSQQSVQAGAASLQDGFPANTFTPPSAGGTPPFGQDFNGIVQQVTAWLRWLQAGGSLVYDPAFVAAPPSGMGGYPLGAVLESALYPGVTYYNAVDGNTTNPDQGGAGWIGNGATAGDVKWRPTNENLLSQGWVQANATTIGSSNSGASQLASSVAQNLYGWLWANFSQTQCPVTGGRGTSALSDFNANKPLQVLDMRGTAIAGMDTMGGAVTTRLNGVPVSNGAANQAGSLIGENLHALIAAENGPHTHANTLNELPHAHGISPGAYANGSGGGALAGGSATQTVSSTQSATTGISINNASQGSGTGHNNVALSLTGTWYLKL
jgi:hypothetical protein